jgi:sorting nexin-13
MFLLQMLWPDGIFVTKHPRIQPDATAAMLEGTAYTVSEAEKYRQQRPSLNSFEYRLLAAKRVGVVREIILGKSNHFVMNLSTMKA